jgi:predicted HTH domain antitoxin
VGWKIIEETPDRRREQSMPVVTFHFRDETIETLGGTPEEFSREFRQAAAIFWYSKGIISQGKGAEIAGMSRREFIEALGRAEVEVIQITAEELGEEVERDLQARRERLTADLPDPRRPS